MQGNFMSVVFEFKVGYFNGALKIDSHPAHFKMIVRRKHSRDSRQRRLVGVSELIRSGDGSLAQMAGFPWPKMAAGRDFPRWYWVRQGHLIANADLRLTELSVRDGSRI